MTRLRVTRFGLLAYALAAITLLADQISKFWILDVFDLPDKVSVHVLPVFSLTMVWNRGVSYGLLTADNALARWALVLFSLLVAAALAAWAARMARMWPAIAVGLIIGGALGNALDRARLGAVADFLDFSGLHFPWVFNVADSAITIGVIALVLDGLVPRRSRPE